MTGSHPGSHGVVGASSERPASASSVTTTGLVCSDSENDSTFEGHLYALGRRRQLFARTWSCGRTTSRAVARCLAGVAWRARWRPRWPEAARMAYRGCASGRTGPTRADPSAPFSGAGKGLIFIVRRGGGREKAITHKPFSGAFWRTLVLCDPHPREMREATRQNNTGPGSEVHTRVPTRRT